MDALKQEVAEARGAGTPHGEAAKKVSRLALERVRELQLQVGLPCQLVTPSCLPKRCHMQIMLALSRCGHAHYVCFSPCPPPHLQGEEQRAEYEARLAASQKEHAAMQVGSRCGQVWLMLWD